MPAVYHYADKIQTYYMGELCITPGAWNRILVGKHEREIPLGKPKLIWEDNIKVDVIDI
jgi:hypothetical protein